VCPAAEVGHAPRPLRLGLIGCGRIAQVAHLPALEKLDAVQLVALADPSAALVRAVAERYRVPSYTTRAAEVLADANVEAVLLAVPDRHHRPLAEAALRAGKHVLVEKPLASTPEEGEALAELVEATGLVLQVGAMKRHDPGLRFARRWLRETVGPVLSFAAWYRVSSLRPGLEATLFPPLIVDPAVREHEAGFKSDRARYLLATHGAHLFDSLRFLLGDLDQLHVRFAAQGDDFAWAGLLGSRGGAVGSFDLTVNGHGEWSEGLVASGSGGSVQIDTDFPFFRRASRVRAFSEADHTTRMPSFTDTDPYSLQLRHFLDAVRGKLAPEPDVRDGLAVLALIQAVQRQVEQASGVQLVG
jgi:predicted dehydrogenase